MSHMTPQQFVAKWKNVTVTERAGSQSHFNDLCDLLGQPKPLEADPTGEWFAFEKGASKATGGDGFADVWKRGCFGWEYEGKHARTLTRLYNERPTWLRLAHEKLDAVVLDAYGWPHDLSDEEILERLLALNLERVAGQSRGMQPS